MSLSRVLLFVSACLAAGTTDFSSLVTSVESELDDLSRQVEAWTAAFGLVGALRIQSAVQPLVNNVGNLKAAAQTVSPAEVTASQLQSLTKSIVAVLQSLTAKESDFSRAGARQIVANDIRDLEKPTVDIINALINSLKQDCDKLETLSPLIPQISNAFNAADKAYGGQPVQFPTPPACQRRAIGEVPVAVTSLAPFTTTPSPVLSPPLSLVPPPVRPNSSEAPYAATTTLYECPPSSSSSSSSVSHSEPSKAASTAAALNNTNLAAVGGDTSSSPEPAIVVPAVIGPANSTNQNNTQLIPLLSNTASSASVKIGAAVAGMAAVAVLL